MECHVFLFTCICPFFLCSFMQKGKCGYHDMNESIPYIILSCLLHELKGDWWAKGSCGGMRPRPLHTYKVQCKSVICSSRNKGAEQKFSQFPCETLRRISIISVRLKSLKFSKTHWNSVSFGSPEMICPHSVCFRLCCWFNLWPWESDTRGVGRWSFALGYGFEVEMGEPAAKKLCTTTLGAVKRVAVEGNIGMTYTYFFMAINHGFSELCSFRVFVVVGVLCVVFVFGVGCMPWVQTMKISYFLLRTVITIKWACFIYTHCVLIYIYIYI